MTNTKQTKQELDNIMKSLRDFIDAKDMPSVAFDLLIQAQDCMRVANRQLFLQEN